MKTNVNRKAIKENRIFLDIENKKHSNILKKIPEDKGMDARLKEWRKS